MRSSTVVLVLLALPASVLCVAASVRASDDSAALRGPSSVVLRCPRASDGLYPGTATADEVIGVARRVNRSEVTHYQGRAERRTAANTPVFALVMHVANPFNLPGQSALAARAKKRCGQSGLSASAVTFHDSLSPICCSTFTLFVVRGSGAWIVFRA